MADLTIEQLLDYTSFSCAHIAHKSLVSDSPEFKKAEAIVTKALAAIREAVKQHYSPIASQPGGAVLASLFLRVEHATSPDTLMESLEALAQKLMPWLRSHEIIFKDTFQGQSLSSARALTSALDETDAKSIISRIARIRPASRLLLVRRAIQEIAKSLDIEVSADESLATDVAMAVSASKELATIGTLRSSLDPMSSEIPELAEKEAKLESHIAALAKSSSNPSVVQAAAIIEKNKEPQVFATKVGKELGMTPEQETALMARGKAIIAAGAGSGKTRVIAGKVVYTVKELGANSGQIIATSFSKKSAKELKDRVLSYGGKSLLDSGDKGFGTTHSIALSLLKEYKPEVGRAKIMESDSYLLKLAMKQVSLYPERPTNDPVPVGMFDEAIAKALGSVRTTPTQAPAAPEPAAPAAPAPAPTTQELSEKDVAFRKALETIRGTSEWALGMYPDAGWAKANIRLIDNLLNRKVTLSQLSETERSAVNTMFGRPAAVKALERKGLGQMTRVGALAVEAAAPAASPGKTPYWTMPANQWFNLGEESKDSDGKVIGPKTFSTQISKYRANMITPSQAWAQEKTIFAAVYGAYEWLKKNDPVIGGQLDFDDMLTECCRMLIENPTARTLLQNKFKHIFVDEAQDQNKMQHLLFGLLSGSYDHTTLELRKDGKMTADTYCLIGDDKQAIYEFRGAKPSEFIEKSDLVAKEQGFKTYLLDTNFRSGKNIVDAANRLISHNTKQIPMVCKTSPTQGEGDIHYITTQTHEEAANKAASEIESATKGDTATSSYKDFGIAVRTNAEAYAYGVEMLKRGIPFRSKMNFFNDATTKALILWLSLAGSTDKDAINDVVLNAFEVPRFNLDNVFRTTLQQRARGQNYLEWLKDNWDTIYTGNQAWRNRKSVYPYLQALNQIHGVTGSPSDILTHILSLSGAEISGKTATILDSLIEKVKGSPEAMDLLANESEDGKVNDESIQALAIAPINPLRGLLESYEDLGPAMTYVKQLQSANSKKGLKDDPDAEDYAQPAVVIDTCHGWKGLETKHMFVSMPGDVFPHVRSKADPEAMESERRLAYVALTRGQENVTLMCPAVNHLGKPAGLSEFIQEACIPPLNKAIRSEPEEDSMGKTATISPLSDRLLKVFASLEEDTLIPLEENWGADRWDEMTPETTDWENF